MNPWFPRKKSVLYSICCCTILSACVIHSGVFTGAKLIPCRVTQLVGMKPPKKNGTRSKKKKKNFAATPHRPPSLRSHHKQWPMFFLLGGYFLTDCCAITHSTKNILKEIFFILNFIFKKRNICGVVWCVNRPSLRNKTKKLKIHFTIFFLLEFYLFVQSIVK